MSIEQTGLPPRRSRNQRTSRPISLKKLIQSGLVVFGALFFGLIGIELYQAKVSHPTAAEGSPVVTTEEPTNVQTAPTTTGHASASGSPTPPSSVEQPTQTAPSSAQTQPTPPPVGPSTAQKSGSSTSSHTGTTEVTGKTASVAKPATDAGKKVTTGAVAEKPKAVKHVVKKGETLYMLSRKYYGNNSSVARIANYNGISLEAQLTEGKVVMVPLSQ
ncbi:LysM peptidoglycan-binding domain-containing protein [Brevibacillus choshinensis]|uniref:LysM peptidoglycan-binding domain-containing protein n=1 Tax=Brevibacillus choshinensis TaxID=54911 RepID=UPI002E1B4F39|nr:LysM peptidoglycan-binding domain-containing protein [Brevibacillus choshinensis]MED4751105.1 LysM peptidoglycan-binding domain-containing protein [Brevibacillus choshinensis]MED4783235.1 LysM peptidoglycan-binding domain-containing protein [Brevibacillus choshinensis]